MTDGVTMYLSQPDEAIERLAQLDCRAGARPPEPRTPCPLDRRAASRRTRITRAGGARLSPRTTPRSN
jgi:hypothetical protein